MTILLLSSCYRRGNWGWERLSNFLKVVQQTQARVRPHNLLFVPSLLTGAISFGGVLSLFKSADIWTGVNNSSSPLHSEPPFLPVHLVLYSPQRTCWRAQAGVGSRNWCSSQPWHDCQLPHHLLLFWLLLPVKTHYPFPANTHPWPQSTPLITLNGKDHKSFINFIMDPISS